MMERYQYTEAKNHLLLTINLLAPTGMDQRDAVDLLHQMEQANESNNACIKALISYLADGMFYGNWPSNLEKMKVKD